MLMQVLVVHLFSLLSTIPLQECAPLISPLHCGWPLGSLQSFAIANNAPEAFLNLS